MESCSYFALEQAKVHFQELVNRIDPDDLVNFLSWVHVGTSSNGDLKNEPTLKQDLALHSIRKALRKKVKTT